MDLSSKIEHVLPLAIEWAEAMSTEIQELGAPLDSEGVALALRVGVAQVDAVRVLEVDSFPLPDSQLLQEAAIETGLLGPDTMGLTLGHSICVGRGKMSTGLLSHELRHVQQYEEFGSIPKFLAEYLNQIVAYGYLDAPLDCDARANEIHT